MAIYPVFAQYKPPLRCTTVFDNGNYDFLSFDEIKKLSTETPNCQQYVTGESDCNYCNFSDEDLQKCPNPDSFEGLQKCTQEKSFQGKFVWTKCESFQFDRSLRKGK